MGWVVLRHSSLNVHEACETETVMKVGYARTSTAEQVAGFEAQLDELTRAACEKVFREQVSSVAPRAQLEAALEFTREGDVLVVSKLDRLARSTQHLLEIADRVKAKRANLQVLNLGIDTGTATGKLLLTMIGAIAQFEGENMLERQREGIAKAKMEGKYKGRAPTARAKTAEARALKAEGFGATQIAKRLGIGRASVYRVLYETVVPS
jgi:DNA invertase Pin-like site-specific DNA recombinase